jgi:hypothetical protein
MKFNLFTLPPEEIAHPLESSLKMEIKEIWATPAEGVTLDELIAEMDELGNKVIKVDRKNNRLKMAL